LIRNLDIWKFQGHPKVKFNVINSFKVKKQRTHERTNPLRFSLISLRCIINTLNVCDSILQYITLILKP